MKVIPYTVAGEPVKVYYPTTVEEAHGFLDWVAQGHHVLALDTETTGLDVYSGSFQVRLVQFGTRDEAWVLRADLFREAIRSALTRQGRFVAHGSFDSLVLDRTGLSTLEEFLPRTIDTSILAHLNDPRGREEGGIGRGLKELSSYFVDGDAPDTEKGLTEVFRKEYRATKKTGWARIDVDHPTYVLYAGLDVILASRLFEVLGPLVRDRGFSTLSAFEHELQAVTTRLMRKGVALDVLYTEGLAKDLALQAIEARKRAAIFGVDNVNSTRQVSDALQGMGWTPVEFTPTGNPKVDKAVLGALAEQGNPLAVAITEAKRAAKWRETYALAMLNERDAADRVHPSINALQARTARMSISRPPLQQLPSSDWTIRRCLIADPGQSIGGVDYKAVEMRVLAALADVPKMKEAIRNGEDLHDFTATLVYGADFTKPQRKLAKAVGFGKVFGGGATTIQRQTGAEMASVKHAIATYDRTYPQVRRFARELQEHAQFGAREVVTPSGRHLPLDRDRLYAATNYMVQSTARDILAQALLDLVDDGLEEYLLLPVHDEVVFQAPTEDAEDVAHAIAKTMSMDDFYGVPIEADPEVYGPSWGHGYGAPA